MSKAYQVFSYDAYDAPPERRDLLQGEFDSLEAADAFARKMIDDGVGAAIANGKSLSEAVDDYRRFGEIPMVLGDSKSNFQPFDYLDSLLAK